jgi:hypothetical protein
VASTQLKAAGCVKFPSSVILSKPTNLGLILTAPVDINQRRFTLLNEPVPLEEKAQNAKPCSGDAVILVFEFPP